MFAGGPVISTEGTERRKAQPILMSAILARGSPRLPALHPASLAPTGTASPGYFCGSRPQLAPRTQLQARASWDVAPTGVTRLRPVPVQRALAGRSWCRPGEAPELPGSGVTNPARRRRTSPASQASLRRAPRWRRWWEYRPMAGFCQAVRSTISTWGWGMEFIALDVETANADIASICAIGMVHFRDGAIVRNLSTLINPQDHFDAVNIGIHGITPEAVASAPTIEAIYPQLSAALCPSIVVHHTHFDRTAFHKVSVKYRLPDLTCRWLDSSSIARRAWPDCAHRGYGLADLGRS